jgi:hypothetical protein
MLQTRLPRSLSSKASHSLQRIFPLQSSRRISSSPPIFQNKLPPHKPNPPDPSPSDSLFHIIRRDLKGTSRWIVYGSLAVIATAETTFWTNVIYAKYFAKEGDEQASALLERFQEAIRGYRQRYLFNYGRYYEANLWGL